jgi:tetratricopeptide (TPR) repeat protein
MGMAGSEENFNKAMNKGHSAAWDQQWDKAAQAYQQALDEFPDHPKALANLGLALFELQRYEESLQVYQRALKISPEDPTPLEKTARLSERLGRTADAIT